MTEEKQTEHEIAAALAAPFAPHEIKFRAGSVTQDKTRAMALAYIDARNVEDRLDEVVGTFAWSDQYEPMGVGNETVILCTLTVLGVSKQGFGQLGQAHGDMSAAKGAESDALKRAAVKFGIARYLYSLPKVWVTYDAQSKQLKGRPDLPSWALPENWQTGTRPPATEQEPGDEPPLKPRAETPTTSQKPPAGHPELFVWQVGKTFNGQTCGEIAEQRGAGYFEYILEKGYGDDAHKAACRAMIAKLAAEKDDSTPDGVPATKPSTVDALAAGLADLRTEVLEACKNAWGFADVDALNAALTQANQPLLAEMTEEQLRSRHALAKKAADKQAAKAA